MPWAFPGEDLKGCWKGIEFLSKVAGSPDKKVPVGKRAAVVGGGNSAIDCVRTLIRLGAEEVYIVYRRTRKEMPANEVEIVAAEHEGVKFQFLAAPVRVIGDEQGRVTGLEYLTMELGEPDASGRRRPVPVEGSETILPIDMLITAIGQQPEIGFLEKEAGKREPGHHALEHLRQRPGAAANQPALCLHRRRFRHRPGSWWWMPSAAADARRAPFINT
jgi:formate dehydrogenase (NADP+) beta subunit